MTRLVFAPAPPLALAMALLATACTDDSASGSDTSGPKEQPVEITGGALITDGAAGGALLSVWSDRTGTAEAPEPVWMVGGTRQKPLVLEVTGGTFKQHDPRVGRRLWWVSGAGDQVFVVGEGGVTSRYDGTSWTPLATDVPGTTLYGVWGDSASNVWAVGGPESSPAEGVTPVGNVILHYDGTAWVRESVPILDDHPTSEQSFLFKVWGADRDHIFVVGSSGLALHYDGATWREEPTGDTAGALFTVSGRSATDVWAIGGLNEMRVIHWDGATWESVPVGDFAPTIAQGLFVAPGVGVVASGISGYVTARGLDGTWAEPDPETNQGFHSVWVDGGGSFWAVGGDIVSADPAVNVIYTTRQGVTAPTL